MRRLPLGRRFAFRHPTGNAARAVEATMAQSDIRGLATAIHRSVAGLPRSDKRGSSVDAHVELSRVPLIVNRRGVSGRVAAGFGGGGSPGRMRALEVGSDQCTAGTCLAMSQTKAASSRARATQILFCATPRAVKRR